MALIGVIYDFQPRCLPVGSERHSALMLPLGSRYTLNAITDALLSAHCKDQWIIPAFEPDCLYESHLRHIAPNANLTIVPPDGRGEQFLNGDSSDSILLLDSRYWPLHGFDFSEILRVHAEHFGAVFAAHADSDGDAKTEHVVLDASGNVRKVQRVYDRMIWSHSNSSRVPYCVVPHGLALQGTQFPLATMRQRIAARGVPLRDLPITSPLLDLSRSDEILRLTAEHAANPLPDEFHGYQRRPGRGRALVADNASVACSAHLVGDVIVNPDAHVGARATLVGPTVIGRGATIGEGATIAQSLIMDRAVVAPLATLHQTVYVAAHAQELDDQVDNAHHRREQLTDEGFRLIKDDKSQACSIAHRRKLTLAVKRAIDVSAAAAGLVVLFPLLAMTALLVKLTSPGPLFFVHRREGKGGREFGCIKFRTMRADADGMQRDLGRQNDADGPQFIMKRDPRVTRLGAILRKSNLDELPQLINVLLGQMSLVGPRPSPFRENQICAPWREARLSIAPGITGLWQVCRHDRDEGDFHQWIYYDVAYVRNLSIRLDMKILWYTCWTFGGLRSVPLEKLLPSPSAPVSPLPDRHKTRSHARRFA